MRKRWIVLATVAALVAGMALANASFWATPAGELTILAHRGVHQDFHREGLTNETCTASRIFPLTHAYIENTLPSMQAAFDAGADSVEIDVHPTQDGEFAVFHDWTLDCRTDGHGVTREQSMAYLRTLDVGYGYTADSGVTYPLRGQGVGMMPTLNEVLAAFPERRFLINFKSNDPGEAEQILAYLDAAPHAGYSRLAFLGARPADRIRQLRPELRTVSRAQLKRCAQSYVLTGWYGHVGQACRNTVVFVPANLGWLAWGWPNLFLERLRDAGSDVVIIAPLRRGEPVGSGLDDAAAFELVPIDWRGGVATDHVEVIGPLVAERRQ